MAKGQICKEERSGDLLVGYTSIEYCAQLCKSLSNTFIYGKNERAGLCYCQAGTKETGRCLLTAYKTYDVYQYKYPGT